jgi:CTP synthase
MLNQQGLDAYIIEQLGLDHAHEVDWEGWQQLLKTVHEPKHEVTIALVGKYIDLPDAYLSVTEALKAGGFAQETKIDIRWVPSDECETPEGAARHLADVDGICVPGGFGVRGIEGKLGALHFARENRIPVLGLCLGLQCMVIEFARNEAGLIGASSTEFDPDTEFPVIATMEEQVDIIKEHKMGGTMRLGLFEAVLAPGSIVEELYDAPTASERHRHRYEVNNHYREQIAEAGMVFSGLSPSRELVEYVELPRDIHPFYVGTQAHPELRSRPNRPHPLFRGLVAAARERQEASRLFEVAEPGERAVLEVETMDALPLAEQPEHAAHAEV